jgi:hypothetical protein
MVIAGLALAEKQCLSKKEEETSKQTNKNPVFWRDQNVYVIEENVLS